ncbi:H+/gluconate symporter [Austwickia chelonae]|uniref:Putative gluconate permease n=1 Tax=Austwickia chelonae NBRC 105200 TaxID=1184607 RepID=K6VQ45_9MICO|nr:SLC13 family permease [Austwickia chelonae]GAB78879.1 putative gluconate permease [Austwickia chelonae NBRC 105200]SEV85781.1 H+/gluconate symporter [Austwickia chelonae]
MVALHTTVAIVAIVLLIIRAKVDPIIALVLGCLYLGLAGGVGFEGTVKAITGGFGDIMAKIGLLIGFGVLIGSLLHTTDTFGRLVQALLRYFGPARMPYGLTVALSTVFPSIYVDVQVVLAAPVARQAAPYIGRNGLALMSGALGTGIFCGYVFVVPGLSAVSIAGLLGIPLGTYLLYGIVLGPVTAVVTTFLFGVLLHRGWWAAGKDELGDEFSAGGANPAEHPDVPEGPVRDHRLPALWVTLLPIVVPLVLIAAGAFAELAGVEHPFVAFLGDANVALFLGLVGAYVLARRASGTESTARAFTHGLHTAGEILLVTGIGGSLGAVIKATGLAKLLGDLFSADAGAPVVVAVLLSWFIAAVLHLAIGSVSVAAITAAGIIAPILPTIGVAPIAVGLAVASGSLFALQVNSNFFWMFTSLLGLSTQGGLKTMTTVTSIASVISLPVVAVLAVVVS